MLTLISLDQPFKNLQICFFSFIKLTFPQCKSMDYLCRSVTFDLIADGMKQKLLKKAQVALG